MISDHLQPWVRAQGHAGHMWTTIGAIAQATDRLEVGTGVDAMVHRAHPIDVAHAAATAAVLSRVASSSVSAWASASTSRPTRSAGRAPVSGAEHLRESIDIIRQLWGGGNVNVDGEQWRVENLRLLDRPAAPPPIHIAVSGSPVGTARRRGAATG